MKVVKFIAAGILAASLFGLQSCSKKAEEIADAAKNTSEAAPIETKEKQAVELLNNAEELQKAEDALKNLPQFKGKELRLFQNVNFYGGKLPRIELEVLNPDNLKDVDHYTYKNGSWSEPQPVQITGEGDMMANTTPLKDVKFAAVATVFKNWTEKAKTIEGAGKEPLDFIYFNKQVYWNEQYWDAPTIEGTREAYNITFNLDGSVREFKKK